MKATASSSERNNEKYDKKEQKQSVRKKQRRNELKKHSLRRKFGILLTSVSICLNTLKKIKHRVPRFGPR
jgi:hypothetical protein